MISHRYNTTCQSRFEIIPDKYKRGIELLPQEETSHKNRMTLQLFDPFQLKEFPGRGGESKKYCYS